MAEQLIPLDVMDAARQEWLRVAETRANWDAALAAALRVSLHLLLEKNADLEQEIEELKQIAVKDAGDLI